jgi:tetratricopeptide (TPR) repeat protein
MPLPALAPGQLVAARFELDRPLAAGHDAATWLAREAGSPRPAVLRLRAADAPGARLAARVAHPALLAPRETLDHEGCAIDVFDFLPGGEIGRLRGRPWPLIARRLLPVADALQAIHASGWVHGDVKSSNVLLDDDGLARLIDLGSAAPVGSAGPRAGSPYSMSPQRHDGAPAAVADDVYAFGVLLHELVSGHPPFYPDITPQRVRSEAPPALTGNPPPPGPLCALVARCLAKQPDARPAGMAEVRQVLERALAENEAAGRAPTALSPAPPPRGDAAWRPQPPPDAVPIRADWRRTPPSGIARDARALRREGFRSGLLVGALLLTLAVFGFVSFVLPGMLARDVPPAGSPSAAPAAPAAAPRETQAGTPGPTLEQQAEAMREAERRRAPLDARIARLESRDVASWGAPGLAAARAAVAAGDAARASREFAVAIPHYAAAARELDALEARLPVVLAERLAAADADYAAGRSAQARRGYEAALRVAPDDARAKRGVERAGVLDQVRRELAAAATAEQAGDPAAAVAAFQRALALDPQTGAARTGLARLRARAGDEAYATAIAAAQSALARRDYAAARTGFERASRLRPGAPEAAEGLEQVRRAAETRDLAMTLERAQAAERAEQWSASLAAYREALAADPALRTAQEGVERVEPRAMLDAELQSFLERPERLFSPSGREVARNVAERARGVAAPGPRLRAQLTRLGELLQQAETPIRVLLASDAATDVQIYRVGKLGRFERRDVELMPGRYTVVGTRAGFRDVRKELNLMPGAAPPTLVVRCEEPI